MRKFARAWRLAMATAACWGVADDLMAASAKPNIVVILADDQGWNGTSVQMDPTIPFSKSDFYQTPNLEALAAAGMRFSAAYSAPACTMTRAAIQTGRSPASLQMTDVWGNASPNSTWAANYTGWPLATPLVRNEVVDAAMLLPQWLDLNNSGYSTAHFGKWHVGNNALSGYDQYVTGGAIPAENPKDMFRNANRAVSYMQERVTANQPFFMQVSLAGTHSPFESTAASLAKYQALAQNLPAGNRHTDPLYAAMTEDLDTATGQIIQKIHDLGIDDNTYIIYTSDNGAIALMGSDESIPLFHSKGSVYEGGTRVPMIVSGPGIQAGAASNVPVMLQDIFATVGAIASVNGPLPANSESANLLPLFHNGGELPGGAPLSRGSLAPNGEIFTHMPHYSGTTIFGTRVPASSVRDGDYKLVRIYGTNGQADTVLLFNLAANITESSDPNSPLNLANSMPEKTSQLLGKLNNWLVATDASLPYDLSVNYNLNWKADQSGVDPKAWRTTNNVDDYFRERFEPLAAGKQPVNTAVAPYQPGLGGKAFKFDGDDGFSHEFFRVSDARTPGIGDFNRSVSVGMTFRTDDLTRDQILFESGDGSNGLSISLGDADANGSKNDLRFRVLGSSGKSLTATVAIDRFADPTKDFIEATAVFSDDPANRYVEIYVNGSLAAHVNGDAGSNNTISWDLHNTSWTTFQNAGLGTAFGDGPGNGLGANGGIGDLPFSGGFKGYISGLTFQNYVLNASQVANGYNAKLDAVSFGVKAASGGTLLPAARPVNVSIGAAEANALQVVQERQHRLASVLAVDGVILGGQTANAGAPLTPGNIAAGTDFTSYLLHLDPVGAGAGTSTIAGSVTFAYDVIGVIADAAKLVATDSILGSIGQYGAVVDRGLVLAGADFITISPNRRTLTYSLTVANNDVAELRILTAPAMAADFNGDGVVDASDLTVWKSSVGVDARGDANGDGSSDGADFLVWQRMLGMTSSVGVTAVPEPAAAVIMVSSLLFFAGARKRRQ